MAAIRISDPFPNGGFGRAASDKARQDDIGIIKRGLDSPHLSSDTIKDFARQILREVPEAKNPVPESEKKK